jgi:uncharacterized protein
VRLYLDANAIIAAHEGPPGLQQVVIERIVQACLLPGGLAITSILTRLECRVKPLRDKNQQLLAQYDVLFGRFGIHTITVSDAIIEQATTLRADHGFRTPDAIHLATALENHADAFLTGDKALTKCPGLHVELI